MLNSDAAPGEPPVVDVDDAANVVRSGGVVAYPTEAVFGLGCDPNQPNAVERIVQLKQRASNKGLILIASDQDQLSPWIVPLSPNEQARVDKHWPGPVTFVVRAASKTPALITGNRDTIAVRISTHPVVKALCRACGHPLVSTSANLSGQSDLLTSQAIGDAFGRRIDAIVAGTLGTLDSATPIFDVRNGEQIR